MIRISVLVLALLCQAKLSDAFGLSCPANSRRVRTHSRRTYIRADGTQVDATIVHEHCRRVTTVDQTWEKRLRSGRPDVWPYDKESIVTWTEEERERVLEALNALPEDLQKVALKGLYRFSKSVQIGNPATWTEGNIGLYDSAFAKDRNLARVLAHELAHESFEENKIRSRDYRRALGWTELKVVGDHVVFKDRTGDFVEADGRIGPNEDFANNLEYFLFQPDVLKAKTPKAYEWIKRHFGDKFKLRTGSK